MPIVRTYGCDACGHFMQVTLRSDQWNDEPPECPECIRRSKGETRYQMQQEFKPVAIGGSLAGKAHALAEKIASEDYGVADMKSRGEGEAPKVRYKVPPELERARTYSDTQAPSTWGVSAQALAEAAANGRHTRVHHGDGLDVLRSTLKTGAQPDLFKHAKLIT